jgi:hypothetical protein
VKKPKLILIIVLSFSIIWAQHTSIGMNIGGNYPIIDDQNAKLYIPSISGYADLNFSYELNDRFSIYSKLIYNNYSENYTYIENQITSFFNSSFQYLYVSPLIKYNFRELNSFYVYLGPYIGFLLDHKIDAKVELLHVDVRPNNYNLINIGANIGIGYEIKINNISLQLEISELLDINNISKNIQDIDEIIFRYQGYEEDIVIYGGEYDRCKIHSTNISIGINYYLNFIK